MPSKIRNKLPNLIPRSFLTMTLQMSKTIHHVLSANVAIMKTLSYSAMAVTPHTIPTASIWTACLEGTGSVPSVHLKVPMPKPPSWPRPDRDDKSTLMRLREH